MIPPAGCIRHTAAGANHTSADLAVAAAAAVAVHSVHPDCNTAVDYYLAGLAVEVTQFRNHRNILLGR